MLAQCYFSSLYFLHKRRLPFSLQPSDASVCLSVPCSLRALYGTDGTRNATHGSDSQASAERELNFFFPYLALEEQIPKTAAEARSAIEATLQKVMIKVLPSAPWSDCTLVELFFCCKSPQYLLSFPWHLVTAQLCISVKWQCCVHTTTMHTSS